MEEQGGAVRELDVEADVPGIWTTDTGLGTRSQIVCAWSGVGLIVLVLAGFLILTGYLPPLKASASAAEVADFYASNTDAIRAGIIIGFLGFTPWALLTAAVGVQLARIQPKRPVLAVLQLVLGAAAFVVLMVPLIILLVTTFRPERSPELTQTLHDLGWIMLFITVPAFSTQALVIGFATLKEDPPVQVYPRWFGYLNIWVAILFLPALLIPFFKSGAFSYQGAAVYWLAFVVFFVWIIALTWAIRRAALQEAAAVRQRGALQT